MNETPFEQLTMAAVEYAIAMSAGATKEDRAARYEKTEALRAAAIRYASSANEGVKP